MLLNYVLFVFNSFKFDEFKHLKMAKREPSYESILFIPISQYRKTKNKHENQNCNETIRRRDYKNTEQKKG